MKNIHILPTKKKSRLFIYNGNLGLAKGFQYGSNSVQNQNIYITSDEEIKQRNWCLDYENEVVKYDENKHNMLFISVCKKIIITTDQDLIKDVVQAIDDEFLKWFVKNPSCESVEVNKENWMLNPDADFFYEIVIPKEETIKRLENFHKKYPKHPKQETTLEKAAERCFEEMKTLNPTGGLK